MVKCPKEVIFSGGNFATISFLGCIQALIENKGFEIKSIKRWVGTSGGAVIAFLLAIGYNPKKILNVIKEVPISKISELSSDKWLTFFDKYGLHDTKCFRDLLKIFLTHLDYCEKITFMEFYEKTRIDLVFTTFCLNTDSLEVLNYEKTPDLKLLDGLCMAIAVPFLFLPVYYRNRMYVDGFLVSNHPIEMCSCNGEESISFSLKNSKKYYDKIDLVTYLRILIRSPLTKLQIVNLKCYKGKNYSILCDHEFDASFEISPEIIQKFYDCGYKTVKEEAVIKEEVVIKEEAVIKEEVVTKEIKKRGKKKCVKENKD